MLVFLPIQIWLSNELEAVVGPLGSLIRNVDEMTILALLPLSFFEIFKGRWMASCNFLIIIFSVVAVFLTGLISGLENNNSMLVTFLGVFDYVKNFLPLFIYAAFFKDITLKELTMIINTILITTMFLGFVCVIQESWAFISTQILHIPWTFMGYWRFGIYRTPSLMNHPNSVGLYFLFVLTLYMYTAKKLAFIPMGLIFTGIIFSISRIAYGGFMLISALQSKGKRWLLIIVISMFTVLTILTLGMKKEVKKLAIENKEVFRIYAATKSLEIWMDHPLVGRGPGMYGGVISFTFDSPVYQEYHFEPQWYLFMSSFKSLDQFWPQLFAEMGGLGAITFFGLIMSIVAAFIKSRRNIESVAVKGLFSALLIITFFIFIYTLGSGLNNTAFLYSYAAFAGIALGYREIKEIDDNIYDIPCNMAVET